MFQNLKTVKNFKDQGLVLYISIYFLIVVIVSFLFYDNLFLLIPGAVFFLYYVRILQDKLYKKRQRRLRNDFNELLKLIKTELQMGHSLENSFINSYDPLKENIGEKSELSKLLFKIISSIRLNMPITDVLNDFASLTNLDEIKEFVSVVITVKKTGGNMIEAISNTSDIITDTISTNNEIESIIFGKKMEFYIMVLIPFLIVAYLRISFSDFLDVLYGNILGAAIMSVALLIIIGAFIAGNKIIDIKI